jgi:hypothetical protein
MMDRIQVIFEKFVGGFSVSLLFAARARLIWTRFLVLMLTYMEVKTIPYFIINERINSALKISVRSLY